MTAEVDQAFLPTDLPKEIPAHASQENEEEEAVFSYSHEVKTLLSWQSPGRPFRKRGKEYFLSAMLLTLFIQIILFLFGQYLLMLVVLALLFVSFALSSVPPTNFHYKISNQGITIEDHFYLWQELYDFFFKKREGIWVLHVRTRMFIPGVLNITLGTVDKDHVRDVLLRYLPYREVTRRTLFEKSGDWLSHNFPLERKHQGDVVT
jgi:hypothetical protein